jgi:hypothetical protein
VTTRQDLPIRQGETWSFVYTKKDSAGAAVNLTGYTARMAIKNRIGGALFAYLSTGTDASGGSIALGGVLGTVTLSMTASQTTAVGYILPDLRLVARGLRPILTLAYDLELISGAGVVTRELEGAVQIHREVTT